MWSVFIIFLKLGLTSFGGPAAHMGYFREEFVVRRKWLTDQSYSDLIALCQFMPGPASSQVGMAIGLTRAGIGGALSAWVGFTLPSALVMVAAALFFKSFDPAIYAAAIHGLKIAAAAIVAHAVFGMAKSLCTDTLRRAIAIFTAIALVFMNGPFVQIIAILVGGLIGFALLKDDIKHENTETLSIPLKKRTGAIYLAAFAIFLILLPILASTQGSEALSIFDSFYRSGALVFGGGHVVLPLLQAELVPHAVSNDLFLAGYGVAQIIPGPLFTFSAYLGAASFYDTHPIISACIALIAIFLPAFLLTVGSLPFWETLRRQAYMRKILAGVNAAVVGLLAAAFYNPIWISSILSPLDFILMVLAFLLLVRGKLPAYFIVLLTTASAVVVYYLF